MNENKKIEKYRKQKSVDVVQNAMNNPTPTTTTKKLNRKRL